VEVNITLFPRQSEALERLKNTMYLLFGGARGGGKSFLARAYTVLRAIKYPRTRHLIIRKSFPELERNHIAALRQEFPWMVHNIAKHVFNLPNGSVIECGFCETANDLQNWQGAECATIVMDEAQFHERKIFEFFKTVLRTASDSGIVPRMLLTGNPGGYAWLKQAFIDGVLAPGERPEDFGFVKSLVTDNPALMKADPEYIERLRSLPEALRKAFLEGDWNAIIGAFFTLPADMEEEIFPIDEGACRGHLYAAVDHGIRHSTASGLAYVDDQGAVHQLFTYLATGHDAATHAAELCDRIKAFPHTKGQPPVKLWYDPSMCIETRLNVAMTSSPLLEYQRVFREQGLGSVIFEPANNSRIFGAQLMQQYFVGKGVPTYRVWRPYNGSFRALLGQIMCDPNNAEVYLKEENPADDLADFVRYMICGIHAEVYLKRQAQQVRAKMMATSERRGKTVDWYTGV
jgi:phage terminase large subunit